MLCRHMPEGPRKTMNVLNHSSLSLIRDSKRTPPNTSHKLILSLVSTCLVYKVCLKSNETGAILFFINNWTTNQHYPFRSSSFGKPYTAAEVIPPPGSCAGSLHEEVPTAGLSRPFGCCPQFQNDDLWGGIWVSGKGISHTDSDQASMGAAEPLEYPFW